jgi:hypothetical protein
MTGASFICSSFTLPFSSYVLPFFTCEEPVMYIGCLV